MRQVALSILFLLLGFLHGFAEEPLRGFAEEPKLRTKDGFRTEMVSFGPPSDKALFAGGSVEDWDYKIRERGWIIKENDGWHLWYTGYNETKTKDRRLGYATSPDGLTWTRWPGNPLNTEGWIEDVCIVKNEDTYIMFAEGRDDIAHWLSSKDKVHWNEQGPLDIRHKDGQPIADGPRGTPTVWLENGTWWLFYERKDLAIYVATSHDLKTWTNVMDEACIPCGPDEYDRHAVAMNQIVKVDDEYYAYYHASALEKRGQWSTCVAKSKDLIHWVKYGGNPILPVNPDLPGASSGTVIHDGSKWRLYTTHPEVRVYASQPLSGR
jgi:beta-1,2-mannobiose phosphorylase / 1,2-beta-oligomannan phosphorylase